MAEIPPAFGIEGLFDPVEVGRGGMGVVYRVQQPALRRAVALKVLAPGADPAGVARLSREGAALGGLTGHPNVVPVIATGQTASGAPYLLMPYFSAGSIANAVRAHGPLPVAEVLRIGIAIAGALSVAHEAGIVHRDVKPENILLSDYGEPMIADFGISRIVDGYQTTGASVSATLAHAAPEVLDGRPPSEAADIYALGSTLYQLLAGEPPFAPREDEALAALFQRIARDPAPDLRGKGVPPSLCAVLEQSLEKDPARRPSTMAEFGRRLQRVEAELGTGPTAMVGVRPATGRDAAVAAERATPDASRAGGRFGRRTLVGIGAAVVLVLAGIGLFALRDRGTDDPARGPDRGGTTGAAAAGSARENPLPLGTAAVVGAATSQWRVTVGFVQADFTSDALAPGARNSAPAPGSRYLGVHVQLEYLGPDARGSVRDLELQAFTSRRGPIDRAEPGALAAVDCRSDETVERSVVRQCVLPFEVRDDEVSSLVLRSTVPERWFVAHE